MNESRRTVRHAVFVAFGMVVLAMPAQAQNQAQTANTPCPNPAPLEAALKTKPGDVPTLVALGKAYLCSGRYRDAQRAFEDATFVDYRNFEAHFFLGQTQFEQGDLEGARFEYQQLITLYPDRLEPRYQLGVVYARQNKTEEAIKAFGEAIEAGKRSKAPASLIADAHIALAGQQRLKGDFDGAAKTYAAALQQKPGDATLLLGQAQALVDAGKASEALPVAYSILNKDPANVAAIMLVAQIFEAQGNPDRALRELDRALTLAQTPKDRAALLLRKGLVQVKMGRRNDAIASLAGAVAANPNAWEAHYNYGVVLMPDRAEDALLAFKNAARLRPDDGETQLGIASAHEALRDHPSAYQSARRAFALFETPSDKNRARFVAGKNAYLAGKLADAATEFRALVASDPNRFEHQLWFGLTLYAQKDFEASSAALEQAVKINTASVEARTNLAAAYLVQNRYNDAVEILKPVIPSTNNVDALTNYGLALVKLERYGEACPVLKRAAAFGSVKAKNLLTAIAGRCK